MDEPFPGYAGVGMRGIPGAGVAFETVTAGLRRMAGMSLVAGIMGGEGGTATVDDGGKRE